MSQGKTKATQQRTILRAEDVPTATFVADFRVSNSLSQALAQERKSCAEGQLAFLNKSKQQQKYVEEARKMPKPPSERITARQEVLSELRREAMTNVSATHDPERDERVAKQTNFLVDRKSRHDQSILDYEARMDTSAEKFTKMVEQTSRNLMKFVKSVDVGIDTTLAPLEKDIEHLGEKTEEDIQEVMSDLDSLIEKRRVEIEEFQRKLSDIDQERKVQGLNEMKVLVEDLHAAAHIVAGEVERVAEEKSLNLNTVLLQNQKASQDLVAKLNVQTLEKSKSNKIRWYKGMMLWKQRRHRHAIAKVLERIHSNEFQHAEPMRDILSRVREKQGQVYEARTSLVATFFQANLDNLVVNTVRSWEEQNTNLNEKTQEEYDALFAELKELKDALTDRGEAMLNALRAELEVHDARQEWGDHESVRDLINADIRPFLQEKLDFVAKLLNDVADVLQGQEDEQHNVVHRLNLLFMSVAQLLEKMRKSVDVFEVTFNGEVEDCMENHKDECAANEATMDKHHTDINEAAYHKDLDEILQKAFGQLHEMQLSYRTYADKLSNIYLRYPSDVAKFFEDQVKEFCKPLSLVSRVGWKEENKPPPPPVDPDADPPTEGAEGDTAAEEEEDLEEWDESKAPFPVWTGAARSGCIVMERLNVKGFCTEVLHPGTVQAKPHGLEGEEEPAEAAPQEATPDAEGEDATQEQEVEEVPVDLIPKLKDGAPALQNLKFDLELVEDKLVELRDNTFRFLGEHREQLDALDVKGHCEEISSELDLRLRRHTNRKGEVQVEWYKPRYGIITNHKDKFERHLMEIAERTARHDAQTDEQIKEADNEEEKYKEKLEQLRSELPIPTNLPMLAAYERKATDTAHQFHEKGLNIIRWLNVLSTKSAQALKKDNEGFLRMCRATAEVEMYSHIEIRIYVSELEELDRQIDERAAARKEKKVALEERLPDMEEQPFKEFMEHYENAVEELCAANGFGRKHGQPRRAAQGGCRALMARATTAQDNIHSLFEYLGALIKLPVDGPVERDSLPPCKLFRICDFFRRFHEPWSFSSEVLGVCYALVVSLTCLNNHLTALKEPFGGKDYPYVLDAVPALCLLREDRKLKPTQEECQDNEELAQLKSAEESIYEDCIFKSTGPQIWRGNTWNAEMASIVEVANDAYKEKGLPDFMIQFLEKLKDSSERSRQGSSLFVREHCDTLRDEVLLEVGDAVFGELASRSIAEVMECGEVAQDEMTMIWNRFDSQRMVHEKRLTPDLANPNAEDKLLELLGGETSRYKEAVKVNRKCRAGTAGRLREQAEHFVNASASYFEALVALVDVIPLHAHFDALPGDESVEPARMSIKRRMRKEIEGTMEIDQSGEKLHKRGWLGIPQYDLRRMLARGSWPADKGLDELEPEQKMKKTKTVESFRSPVHKKLVDRRDFHYERFDKAFREEVKRRDSELSLRESQEFVGRNNWKNMVRQLKSGEADGLGIDDDDEVEEEEADAQQ